jgi:hypothetical protein
VSLLALLASLAGLGYGWQTSNAALLWLGLIAVCLSLEFVASAWDRRTAENQDRLNGEWTA